ncbi:GNAT family N-acetyltransferase [Leptolyngbya cf. ectocarpi LEGE 11479]|uniref:GNAT family N-acetyltransferase n=1 Tax=Leptolyngbya cf. ectocarpi LEGE 11479 TaxID=1828722 RepID=A0A928ZZU3_LEPEC|nr:GNAT family N-acetyltransferase [Leptolyngbya ectocarpi]MBE9070398.1 GNAT family N-acetyltransferase [Leptolyngbya cf. ectocarpi LEGE 11479]
MISIRQAHLDDSEVLAHLAERTFRETFTTENNLSDMESHCAKNFGTEIQRQEILNPNCATILAEVAGQLVAFAQVQLHSPKGCVSADHPAELHRLYVGKEWHGQGVAHKIMSKILSTAADAGADHIWLGVWEHNPRAIAFYGKYGFRVVGEHIFQFGSDPQRDLVMVAKVNESLMA